MTEPGELRLVIVTGLSGAGKTQALRSLEDLGFFCIDNLPPTLLPKFAELCTRSQGTRRAALVIDVRGGQFFQDLSAALADLEKNNIAYEILFLEASDDVLVRRFKETRRPHPLAREYGILEAIRAERAKLQELRNRARVILDTTDLGPRKLKEEIAEIYGSDEGRGRMIITVIAFGYKHGLPRDADLVLDVRFLPNPYYVPELKDLDGNDPAVKKYVLEAPVTKAFLRRFIGLLRFLLPQYSKEGKSQVSIAVGCTGGKHRSVVIAGKIAELLRKDDYTVIMEHRDVEA